MNVDRLQKVKALILEEPKRVNMDLWAGEEKAAPCGTEGCIAGWAMLSTLKSPRRAAQRADRDYAYYISFRRRAQARLSLANDEANRLFYSEEWPEPFRSRLLKHNAKTKAYARVVAARIDHFIATGGAE